MKQFYTLFLVFSSYFTFGQSDQVKYDYFVQFNGTQLTKKISVAEVLNHPLITRYSSKKPDLDFSKYTDIIQFDQKITVHGSLTDSIPYYQVTIPIKNKEAVTQFLIKDLEINKRADNDGIKDFGKYSVFKTRNQKNVVAWNDNYLVIVELVKPSYSSNFYKIPEPTIPEDSLEVGEIYEEIETGDPVVEIDTPANSTSDIIIEDSAPYDYAQSYEQPYTIQEAIFDREQAEQLNDIVKSLFENGFTPPASSKINAAADISSWVDYGKIFSSLYAGYRYPMAIFGGYDKYLPMQKNLGSFVKGINVDFYFEKDNARIEEIIEYSEDIAGVVSKISNRKINKNIFNYFPSQKPLGYFSYHINTKAMLESFPSLTAEIFQNPKFTKEDISLVTDLISTMVDEDATAKLFDGDLSAFLYDVKEVEVLTKKYGYDENYEETVTEEKVKKQIPQFSMIFTSTHPTFADKFLQLGVRKKVLTQTKDYYLISGTKEYGDIFILKDKDVIVVSNTMDYFNAGKGSFVKETKKDLSKNYFFGKLSIAQAVKTFGKNAKESDFNKLESISAQFSDVTIESAKKLIDNKLKFIFKLNSLQSDKNIILQTLDFADQMTSK